MDRTVDYLPGYNPCLDMGGSMPGEPYILRDETISAQQSAAGAADIRPQPNPCPTGSVPYSVEEGDTLYSIGRLYGASVADILSANPGLGDVIYIGQTLCIPIPKPCRGQKVAVRSGDTFYSIARRYGVSVTELMNANANVTPDMLAAGSTLCVPQPQARPCPAGAMTYTVVQGDTLTAIAERFSVSIYGLTIANPGVAVDSLMPGMRLCIAPFSCQPPCVESERYTLSAGEDLHSVASRFHLSTDDILRANPFMPPCYFIPGNTVCIPNKPATQTQANRRRR